MNSSASEPPPPFAYEAPTRAPLLVWSFPPSPGSSATVANVGETGAAGTDEIPSAGTRSAFLPENFSNLSTITSQ